MSTCDPGDKKILINVQLLFSLEFHLSLCTVLVAHVGGGVLIDAVVGEVGEHISNFSALVAVFVGREPEVWRLLDHLEVSIPTT